MAEARSPRQLVHRGVVEAAAVLIDASRSTLEARRRVVRAWTPGASVHRLGEALLVCWPAPRWIDCAAAPGLVLVRAGNAGGALCSAPLAPDEMDEMAAAPPPGSVVRVRGGVVSVVVPAETDREDPARYLDVDDLPLCEPRSLGREPAPPAIVCAPKSVAARVILGVGEAPAERSAVLAALLQRRQTQAQSQAEGGPLAGSPRALPWLATMLTAIAGLVGQLLAPRRRPISARAGGRDRSLAAVPAEPAGPSIADRLSALLRTWAARLLVRARLAHLIGRRQAEYVDRLMEMLDRGDLGEALRHAIPLGKDGGDGLTAPMLGVPRPRSDLSIPLAQGALGAGMFGAPDLYLSLQKRYRAAFERLEREGRIDEAAFVLAELLHDEAEAVAFLERHGRLRLAAELAEARRMPPGLQVRQWFLAGERARAIAIARRHGAFADALARMDKDAEAADLRALWADALADAGDFAAAVEVIWPIVSARALGAAWIDRAIAQGGAAAARMLVKKLALVPGSFPAVRDHALVMLAEEGLRATLDRRALAEALTLAPPSPETRTLARAAARALARDGGISGDRQTQQLVSKLVGVADDAALRADLPAWPTVDRTPLAELPTARRIEIAASDTGATAVLDAAHLPGGNTVIALGEAGVRVLARSGKVLFSLDEPADKLVISDRGDRALALSPRGPSVFRLARLDLAGRRSEPWCEARIDCFARTFDGDTWVAVAARQLLVIDALEARFAALASFDLEASKILAVGRSASACSLIGYTARRTPDGTVFDWHRLRHDLPSWTLRAKHRVDLPDVRHWWFAAGPSLVAVLRASDHVRELSLLVSRESGDERLKLPLEGDAIEVVNLAASDRWIACALPTATGVEVRLLDAARLVTRAEIRLGGAKRVSLRLGEEALTIADDRGRVLVMELGHGGVIHDLRL